MGCHREPLLPFTIQGELGRSRKVEHLRSPRAKQCLHQTCHGEGWPPGGPDECLSMWISLERHGTSQCPSQCHCLLHILHTEGVGDYGKLTLDVEMRKAHMGAPPLALGPPSPGPIRPPPPCPHYLCMSVIGCDVQNPCQFVVNLPVINQFHFAQMRAERM